jgi:hypothetical protein
MGWGDVAWWLQIIAWIGIAIKGEAVLERMKEGTRGKKKGGGVMGIGLF